MSQEAQSTSKSQQSGAADDTEALRRQLNQLRSDLDAVSQEFGNLGRAYVQRGKGAVHSAGDAAEGMVRAQPILAIVVSLIGGLIVGFLMNGRGRY